jgi:hypothetical protein
MTYVVREYGPQKRVVLEGKGDSVHARDDIGFASTRGGTRITYTADISLLGASSVVEPFLKRALDRVGKDAVRGLQAALTEEPPPPGRSRLTDHSSTNESPTPPSRSSPDSAACPRPCHE